MIYFAAVIYEKASGIWEPESLREMDADGPRWVDGRLRKTQKRRKEKHPRVRKGRRGSLSRGCFGFILPLSAAGRGMVQVGEAEDV